MYSRSTAETIMDPIGQNVPVICLHLETTTNKYVDVNVMGYIDTLMSIFTEYVDVNVMGYIDTLMLIFTEYVDVYELECVGIHASEYVDIREPE